MSIFITGAGAGDTKSLTCSAKEKIENADIIIGAKRVAKPFECDGKRVVYEYKADKIVEILEENTYENSVILFSGDVSFFSGAKKLIDRFPDAEIEAGISSVSYFCAKIKKSYDEAEIVSMHGRKCNIVSEVRGHKKVIALLGDNPCGKLCKYGLGGAEIYIGENLSYTDEKILHGKAEDFKNEIIAPLSVIMIINKNYDDRCRIGITEDEFVRGKSPITKREVRTVSISALEIRENDICYDIGAGTGSVSVEMALAAKKGTVYAVEKNSDAVELINENAVKFMTDNIVVVKGEAPEALENLPRADKVFIGGSSGKIDEIIRRCNCSHIVVNAITLETLSESLKAFKEQGYDYEITQLSTARGKKIATYNMMTAQNPVFIIKGIK